MSTEAGKLEVTSVIDGIPPHLLQTLPQEMVAPVMALLGEGLVVMKVHRSPFAAQTQSDLVIARRNPKALWMSDYEDRILYDGRNKGDAKYVGVAGLLKALIPGDAVEHLATIMGERVRQSVDDKTMKFA